MKIIKIDDNTFILRGKIKEISDYHDIKALLEKRKNEPNVEVRFEIPQAREVNYYILGYWLKLARKNGFKFHFSIANSRLYDTFIRLGLHQFFEVVYDDMEQHL
ncbi:hypothetical protein [uncultured Helicobacter sp.]|uniref:hypothetical protein n=1 Tax=uncultured Helicobacter sp. TaxID=175537 RepID=UPI0026302301|nr:hypothetical protein [uncultured Helicobacter sp.]